MLGGKNFGFLAFKPPSRKPFNIWININFIDNYRCTTMIKVTRLNDSVIVVNVEKIQSLQSTPDTVITFTNRDKIMVKEPMEEISQRIVEYQRAVNCTPGDGGDTPPNFDHSTG
jgi:flagellar protein FlbD